MVVVVVAVVMSHAIPELSISFTKCLMVGTIVLFYSMYFRGWSTKNPKNLLGKKNRMPNKEALTCYISSQELRAKSKRGTSEETTGKVGGASQRGRLRPRKMTEEDDRGRIVSATNSF